MEPNYAAISAKLGGKSRNGRCNSEDGIRISRNMYVSGLCRERIKTI